MNKPCIRYSLTLCTPNGIEDAPILCDHRFLSSSDDAALSDCYGMIAHRDLDPECYFFLSRYVSKAPITPWQEIRYGRIRDLYQYRVSA